MTPRRRWLRNAAGGGLWLSLPAAVRYAWAQPATDDDPDPTGEREDHRAWQHGIDLLRVDGRLLLVWGSAGNPPRPNVGGDWPHDIYFDWLDPGAGEGAGELRITPKVLVSRPEAQEPPSAAINSRGVILVTAEDGEDDINQRAGLWDAQLKPIKPYPFTIRKGGHSGHAAALGERFLVTYSEGWVDGGGFLNRGTGLDVHARILEGNGRPGPEINLARGQRDGWPQVAASDRNWMVIWQRYAGPSLWSAVIDTQGRATAPQRIATGLPLRYAYDVAYAPSLGMFVVAGNEGEQGFVALLDHGGKLLHKQGGLPALVSEARLIIGPATQAGLVPLIYPVKPRGLAWLNLRADGVALRQQIEHPHPWDYMGTTGTFLTPRRLLLATLTLRGTRAFTAAVPD